MRELLDADIGAGGSATVYREGGRVSVEAGTSRFSLTGEVLYPRVRRVRAGLLLLFRYRTSGEPNASLYTDSGEHVRSFYVGDGVQDVLVCGSKIVLTYFDEGVFSGEAFGREGVVVFNQRGDALWGYASEFGREGVDVADCYCACTDGDTRVWFSPYTEFPLVELDVERRKQIVTPLPEQLSGASALSVDRSAVYVAINHVKLKYESSGQWPDRHEPEPEYSIFAWRLGSPLPVRVSEARGMLRGLPHGRFITVRANGFGYVTPAAEPVVGADAPRRST